MAAGLTRGGVAILAAALVSGCGAGPSASLPANAPPPAATAPAASGAAVDATRAQIVAALATKRLILADTLAPYRPPEIPDFVAAPRTVYQVTLPADPTAGYVAVYEFRDTATAADAAARQAAYLGSGPGLIQSGQGTVHVIRVVGSTVVYYSWRPAAARDPRAPDVQAALDTLGTGFDVSS